MLKQYLCGWGQAIQFYKICSGDCNVKSELINIDKVKKKERERHWLNAKDFEIKISKDQDKKSITKQQTDK